MIFRKNQINKTLASWFLKKVENDLEIFLGDSLMIYCQKELFAKESSWNYAIQYFLTGQNKMILTMILVIFLKFGQIPA